MKIFYNHKYYFMKRVLLAFLGIFLMSNGFAQTILFQEDFEGSTISMTSSSTSGNNDWGVTTTLASQGLKSDSATVATGDTLYLTTGTINCTNMTFVQLEFDHICKLEFFDAGEIQYSADGGTTWQKVTTGYLGNGQFLNIGNKFNSTAYPDWMPSNNNAIPTNTWWKHETFDLSTVAANQANFMLRFALCDVNNSGSGGNYGWLVDSVVVTAAFSELIPPSVVMVPPVMQDTAYTSGPFDIVSYITDGSGIDTAQVIYQTSTGLVDTLGMNLIAPDTFKASIPFYGYGRSITYYVKAIDASAAHNVDSAGPYTFFCKYSPGGSFVVGTGTNVNTTTGYPSVFGQFYTGDREQYLILASELNAINAVGGAVSQIGFDVVTANSATSTGANHTNFTIKLKNTTSSALTSNFETGLTQVYTTSSYQTTAGWNNFTFANPFVWDGVSNLLVEICFDNYQGSGDYSDNAIVNRTTTSHTSALYYRSDGGGVCVNGTGTTSSIRPNMSLVMATPSNITNDAGVYAFTNPTGGVIANQSFPIKVKVKNFGVDTLTSATINWKFDGVSQTPFSFQDTLLPDSISAEIQLGTKTVSGGSHYLLAWTDNPGGVADFNVANDSASISFFACAALLNGNYTIGGTGADYATFSDAVLALNQCGISGPVTFNVAAGTYTEQIEVMTVNGSSATNTVTFQAANGDSTSVVLKYDASGTVDNYVVKLNGASNVKFNSMTIEATDSTYCRAVVLGNVLENVSFTNSIIKSTIVQSADDNAASLVFTNDSIGKDISFMNNLFMNGSRGIELFSNAPRSGWELKYNTFENQYAVAANLTSGMSSVIASNMVTADTLAVNFNGFTLANCSGSAQVYKNHILVANAQIGYGVLATNSVFDSLVPARIYNNFVQIHSTSSSTTLSSGLSAVNSPNMEFYYNTVHMTGTHTLSTNMLIFDQNATPNSENLHIMNNIFSNAAGGYIYYTNAVDTADFHNDYNNLYNWNNGEFGRLGGSDISSFANWKTETDGESNGDTINPYYTGVYDLHVNNNLLNGRAMPIAGITDDFDGDTRSTTTPDFGADEFTPSPYDVTTLEVLAPMGACGLDTNETVIVRYKNVGSAAISGNITASYQLVGSSTVVTENITTTINAGDTLDFSFATTADLSVATVGYDSTFSIKAWADLTGDNVPQNDTVIGDVESGYVPAAVILADDTIQYGEKDTLIAQGQNIYWWEYDTSTVELANDTMFITPNLYDTTTYWVSDRAGVGLMDVLFGGGTGTNTTSGYPTTYGNYYWGNKEQYLVLASELQAMGLSAGPIQAVSFEISALNALPPLDNFEISIGHTSVNSLSSFIPNLTPVFTQATGYMPSVGWNAHSFSQPFMWDGTSNIVVQMCSNNSAWVSSGNATTLNHTTNFVATLNSHADASGVCAQTNLSGSYQTRPNMKLTYEGQGCFGDRTPVTVYVTGFPQYDAGLDSLLLSPIGSVPSGTPTAIKAKLNNFGQVTITSLTIPYKINGVIQDSLMWTGSLPYGASDTIVIDSVTLAGGQYTIEAFTKMPNGVADIYNTNDTAYTNITACLNGTYSIGDTAFGADYPTFASAINDLQIAGICGNVIFEVDTGIYNEQVEIPSINGMDANNTVTFIGVNGDSSEIVLEYSSTAYNFNYTLLLDGAEYFTFNNMTIKALSSSYPGVVEIKGGSKNITFMNNQILGMPVNTSYARGFYVTGGLNEEIHIENNYISDVYYGIYLYGSSTTSLAYGNSVINNTIENTVYYGIYAYYQDSLIIDGNYISDSPTLSLYGYGVYLRYCDNGSQIVNNVMVFNASNYKYGLYAYYCDGTTNERNLIANNMLSILSGTGANYGMYIAYCNNSDLYHNTVNITSGSASSRALHVIATVPLQPLNIVNNIWRDSVGYTVYVGTNSGIGVMDHNSHYSTSSNMAYWGGNRATLAALQTASSKGANSVVVDPLFFASDDLHMLSTQLSGLATPLTEVPTDIDGEPRSTVSPTIGADEVPLLPYDIGVKKILYVPDSTLEGASTALSAEVKNYGTDTVTAYDISYSVNGGTAVIYNFTGTFLPGTVDTIALTPFTSPAGISQVCATTILATDSNAFNDGSCRNFFGIPTKDAFVTDIIDFADGCGLGMDTVKIWIKNIGIDTINAPNTTAPTVSYKANTATTVTENFTTQLVPGDSVLFTFTALVNLATNNIVDSLFNITAWIDWTGDNVNYNDTVYTSVLSLHLPLAPTASSPVNVPYGSPVTLTASSVDSILWYNDPADTMYFHMGSSYTTSFMYVDDTFYVAALNGQPNMKITEVVQFKTGTGATTYPTYMPTGDFDGIEITNLGSGAQDLSGWTIHVRGGQTINYTFPAGTIIGAGEVFTCFYGSGLTVGPAGNNMINLASSTSISSSTAVGYILKNPQGTVIDAFAANNFNFTSGDGVTSADWSGSLPGLSGNAGAVRTFSDNNTSSDWSGTSTTPGNFGTLNPSLANTVVPGCNSPFTQIIVHVTGQLANDMGLTQIIQPVTAINLSSSEDVKVRVKNFGTAAQNNIKVGYTLNNGPVVWDTVQTTINPNATYDHTFSTTADLSQQGQTYAFKMFTAHTGDGNQINDTLNTSVSNLLPNYCACSATSGAYEDLTGISIGSWSYTNTATGAMYTDYTSVTPTAIIGPGLNYPISVTSDFSPGYSTQYNCWANVFIDFNRDGDFDDAGELAYGAQTQSSNTVSGTLNVPFTAIPGVTRMRVVLRESGNQGNTGPCNTYTWGETEDYNIMILTPIAQDAGVELFLSPSTVAASNTVNVIAQVRNYGTQMFDTVPVTLILNGGTPMQILHIDTVQSMDSTIVNLGSITLNPGANNICAYTSLAGDINTINDQRCKAVFREAVVNMSYVDDFEGSDLWMPDTIVNQWERGTPSMTNISSAHSGTKVWAIDLDSTYANSSEDYLYTPRVIIPTTADSAYFKFWHYYNVQTGTNGDGCHIQYSVNGGFWAGLGYIGDPYSTNWVTTNVGGTHMWNGNSNAWAQSTYTLDFVSGSSFFYGNQGDTIQFRFVFHSNASNNSFDGWAIDDVEISLPKIPFDAGVVNISTPGSSTQTGSSVSVSIDVRNFGTSNLTSIPVSYQVSGGNWVNETFTPASPLLPDSVATYTFTQSYQSPGTGYNFCAKTSVTGDTYSTNDEMCKQIATTQAAIDGAVTNVTVTPVWPGPSVDTTKVSFDLYPIVEVTNNGTDTLKNFTIEYKTNASSWTTETVPGPIAPGASSNYQFTTHYNCPIGAYTLTGRISIANDANTANDEADEALHGILDVGMEEGMAGFYVKQNEPNPASERTLIEYAIPNAAVVKFELRNTLGQSLRTIQSEQTAGVHTLELDIESLSNGVYYYTIEVNKQSKTMKMIISK
jgi:hypothetical protein